MSTNETGTQKGTPDCFQNEGEVIDCALFGSNCEVFSIQICRKKTFQTRLVHSLQASIYVDITWPSSGKSNIVNFVTKLMYFLTQCLLNRGVNLVDVNGHIKVFQLSRNTYRGKPIDSISSMRDYFAGKNPRNL